MPIGARDLAPGLLGHMPRVADNPNAQSMVDVIRGGDSKRGEQIARNLCDTYGIEPEDAVRRAQQFLHIQ